MINAIKSTYQFYYNLILHPKKTYKKFFNEGFNTIPYFNFAIVLYCLAFGIDSADRQLMRSEIQSGNSIFGDINNWMVYWPKALFSGLFFGYIKYLFMGWLYNLRVDWSKGVRNIEKARAVNLFNSNILDFFIVYLALCATLIYKVPVPNDSGLAFFDLLSAAVILIAIGYSVYLNFEAAIVCFKC